MSLNDSLDAKPQRIQRQRTKGWKLPENTICVDRSTVWGNPWKVGGDVRPVDAVDLFRCALETGAGIGLLKFRMGDLWKLRGKNLACFCPVDAPHCHADVLITLANKEIDDAKNITIPN